MSFTLKEKMLSLITVMSMVVGMGMLAGCSSSDNPSGGGTAPEKADLDVMLFHDTKDDVVPVENFYAMSQFLKAHGIKTQEFVDEYSSQTTKDLGVTNHEVSALTFFLRIIEWMTANYK